jgi:alpha-glucosidase
MYRLKKAEGASHEEIMEVIWASGRDNSRTPMQWSDELNAGFSTGDPWMKVNPNYKSINVESQKKDETSILNFYKAMIRLKKNNEVFTYGTYDLLLAEDPQVYAYTRTLNQDKVLVIANLSEKPAKVEEVNVDIHNLFLSNYDVKDQGTTLSLQPYEARVYRM